MAGNITLRKYNQEDIVAVAEFRTRFPASPLARVESPDYHRWKCLLNPAATGYIWLAKDGTKIVATASMTPKKMFIHGQETLAAETGDTFTLPDYHGKGIFTSLVKNTTDEAMRTGIQFIYGLPNTNSLPGYLQKLAYGQLQAPQLYYLGKPLNIRKILQKKFNNRFLSSVLAPFFKAAFKCASWLATMRVGNDIIVSAVETFPDDIDQLWAHVSPRYDIMVKRDKNYLDWRYVASPNSYYKFIARDKKGGIMGYLVARISPTDNGIEGYIPDFFTREEDARIFKTLIIAAFRVFRENRVDIVSAWSMKGSYYYKTLVKYGFLPWTKIPLICYKNEPGTRILNQAFKWHFTQGDSDGI
jgi:hypothetical protein